MCQRYAASLKVSGQCLVKVIRIKQNVRHATTLPKYRKSDSLPSAEPSRPRASAIVAITDCRE